MTVLLVLIVFVITQRQFAEGLAHSGLEGLAARGPKSGWTARRPDVAR